MSETYVPAGFLRMQDFYVTVDEHGRTYFFVVENRVIQSYIRIVKTDITTGRVIPVAGTTFRIWCQRTQDWISQRVTYPTVRYIDEFTTSELGKVHLPQPLVDGTYEIHEILAPTGYVLSTEPIIFTIDGSNALEGVVLEIPFPNAPVQGKISITKTDSITGDYLQYAKFNITAATDITTPEGTVRAYEGEVVATLVTDESGHAISDPLFLGLYLIQEVVAPDGFILDETIHEIEISFVDQYTAFVFYHLDLENTPNAVKILKQETYTKIPLSNVEFSFWQDDLTRDELDEVQVLKSNDEGEIVAKRLNPGIWHIQETAALYGYLIDETITTVLVTNDGLIASKENFEMTVTNTLDSSVVVSSNARSEKWDSQEMWLHQQDVITVADQIIIEHHNIRPNTEMGLRVSLNASFYETESVTIYQSELMTYLVDEMPNWQPGDVIAMEISHKVEFDWTKLSPDWQHLYFSVDVYNLISTEALLIYKHNRDDTEYSQRLFARYIAVDSQAHTGNSENQFFIDNEIITFYDDLFIEQLNIEGYNLKIQGLLFNHSPDGVATISYTTPNLYFHIQDDILAFYDAFVATVDTSLYPLATEFFWAARIYTNAPGDEDDNWILRYEHNFDGSSPTQRFFAIAEPEMPTFPEIPGYYELNDIGQPTPEPELLPETGTRAYNIAPVVGLILSWVGSVLLFKKQIHTQRKILRE